MANNNITFGRGLEAQAERDALVSLLGEDEADKVLAEVAAGVEMDDELRSFIASVGEVDDLTEGDNITEGEE